MSRQQLQTKPMERFLNVDRYTVSYIYLARKIVEIAGKGRTVYAEFTQNEKRLARRLLR
jgi:hypothetical protein